MDNLLIEEEGIRKIRLEFLRMPKLVLDPTDIQ